MKRPYVNPEVCSAASGILKCRWQEDSTLYRKLLIMRSTTNLAKKSLRGQSQEIFLKRCCFIRATNGRPPGSARQVNNEPYGIIHGSTGLTGYSLICDLKDGWHDRTIL